MGYVERSLGKDEKIVFRAKPHWMFFGLPVFFLLLAVLGFALGIPGVGWFCGGVALLAGVQAVTQFFSAEYCVTNRRVVLKTGLVRRHALDIFLNKVEAVAVDQGPLGQMLDYGTIAISGTGSAKEFFHKIANPLAFKKHIDDLVTKK